MVVDRISERILGEMEFSSVGFFSWLTRVGVDVGEFCFGILERWVGGLGFRVAFFVLGFLVRGGGGRRWFLGMFIVVIMIWIGEYDIFLL